MDGEPIWLTFEDLTDNHDLQIARFGGLPELRDENLVRSAFAAPIHLFQYEEVADPLELGVHFCSAVLRNHAFNDGNKRTAVAAMIEFLALNGWDLMVPDDRPEAPLLGQWIEELASRVLTKAQLYERLMDFIQERP